MRIADHTQGILQRHSLLGLPPVMRNLFEPVELSSAEVIQRAMTVSEFLTHPHEAAPDQNNAVWIIPFFGDGPFQFSLATGLRLRQPFVFP